MKDKIKKKEYDKVYRKINRDRILKIKKRYRENNREKILEAKKEYCKDNKHKIKEHHLKSKYNIDLNKYNEMFNGQHGNCAICGLHQSELKLSLSVDHGHDTNCVRGLLCNNCNMAIGLLKESTDILIRAVDYLKRNNAIK